MSTNELLRANNIKKYYPVRGGLFLRQVAQVHAVDDVTFCVNEGETLGLVGETGCGKSTIAKTVLRLEEPTAGEIYFAGQDITKLGRTEMRSLRRQMQIVMQDPSESLNARHTVGAILEEPYIIHKLGDTRQRKKWVAELLEKVGLSSEAIAKYPHEFSGGQRQRIGIARAIALKPKLLVCDEPVSALDVSVQSQILNVLLELQQQMNLTVLFIAHDLAVVKHVSDSIAVMYLGRIVESASSNELVRRPLHPYTRSLIKAIPIADPVKKAKPELLEGDVPSPITPPSGCRFHTRCQYVQDACKSEQPELKSIGDSNHRVACHFAEQIDQESGSA